MGIKTDLSFLNYYLTNLIGLLKESVMSDNAF